MGVVFLYLVVRPGSTGDFPACVLNTNVTVTHVPPCFYDSLIHWAVTSLVLKMHAMTKWEHA